MKNLVPTICLVLVAVLAFSDWLASTQEPAPEPVQSSAGAAAFDVEDDMRVIVLPPRREVHWDTLDLEDNRPRKLVEVPAGQRFVLTDLWTMRHNEYPQHWAGPTDRLWLEDEDKRGRRIVFDAKLCELPYSGPRNPDHVYIDPAPLHWESGVSFGPGHVAWFSYDFDGEEKRSWIRRVHFSGYFEDVQPVTR